MISNKSDRSATHKQNEIYDAVIVGAGLSSILCAALLAKAGKYTCLVDQSEERRDDNKLKSKDSPVLLGMGPGGPLKQCFEDLGIDSVRGFNSISDRLQIVAPDYRINFSSEKSKSRNEILREFDGREANELSIFSGYESSSLKKVKEFSRLQDQVIRAFVGNSTYALPKGISTRLASVFLEASQHGYHYYLDGFEKLKQTLLDAYLKFGGEFKVRTKANSLVVQNGKATGVLLSSFEGVVKAKNIIIGDQHERLYKTFPADFRDPFVTRDFRRLDASHWRLGIQFVINKSGIPQGMAQNLACVSDFDLPLENENFISIQVLPHEQQDKVTLHLRVLVPCRQEYRDGHFLRMLAGRVLRRTEEVMPFLEMHIHKTIPEFRSSSNTFSDMVPNFGSDNLDHNLFQYYVRESKECQGLHGLSWATPHQNVYFLGSLVWPALGTYGEAKVARDVVESIVGSSDSQKVEGAQS